MSVEDASIDPGSIIYPHAEPDAVSDEMFGVPVDDPWRWLEGDVRSDARVEAWVEAEATLTASYLAALPSRDAIAARLTQLWDFERIGLPVRRGGRYFHTRNAGLDAQPALCVRESLHGEARVLIDPNGWADDGATALAEWMPSRDGRRIAYAVQDGGSDWRTIRVLDVESGSVQPDEVRWVKFSALAWAGNGSGFFYARFPEPKPGAEHQAANHDHAVWFHRLGSDQSADFLVYATPDRPRLNHVAETTEDGRWLLISSSEGTDRRHELTLIDLVAAKLAPKTLIRGLENEWRLAGSAGDLLYFVTDLAAPRRRIVSIDVASPMRRQREIVAEGDGVLVGAALIGDRLLLLELHDVHSELRIIDRVGKAIGAVALPGIGTVSGVEGEGGNDEGFFAFTSYDRPTEILRIDMATAETSSVFRPQTGFDPERFIVEQTSCRVADGTLIPLFLLRRRDAADPAPTILYGYGGFGISLLPGFSPAALNWAEMGGVYAVANIRGGGEYGRAWHQAATKHNRQTAFDDFIAVAEHLVASGVTPAGGLAIHGHSNGGLLVSAVTNQRPELFAAALPSVGVHDMLRFPRFTAGRYWIDDYGDPAREEDFRALASYSPLHNIRDGVDYPAILVTTADTDDRVVPAHSFKYAAALQAADIGDKPHLIRIDTRAGHGDGKPVMRQIEEAADLWAFAARWTGLGTSLGFDEV